MTARPCVTCGTGFDPVGKARYCSWDCRHGTNAGYTAGCKCPDCRAAHARLRKLNRIYPAARGHVPALGTQRRLQALACLGWSYRALSVRLGRHTSFLQKVMARDSLERPTVILVAELYDALCMTIRCDTAEERRTADQAREKGYVPPLAWDDIDDPDETPTDWEYQPPDRGDVLRDLSARGAGVSEACRVLDITRAALQKWCGNNDLSPLYRELVAREDGLRHSNNQYRKDVA